MRRFFSLVGATALGALGWTLGYHIGLMTAVVLSSVGTGLGMYYGAKLARAYGG